jgi:hypothetical protein
LEPQCENDLEIRLRLIGATRIGPEVPLPGRLISRGFLLSLEIHDLHRACLEAMAEANAKPRV